MVRNEKKIYKQCIFNLHLPKEVCGIIYQYASIQ